MLGYDPARARKRARLSVCVVYPNSYAVGMDNLGFQGVYRMLASTPGVHCERAFFERGLEGTSLESGLPLRQFDVLAFSVSYENDLVNVLKTLRASGIAPYAADRPGASPFLLAGGVGVFTNPEPVSPFMDAIFLGEADEAVPEILEAYLEGRKGGRQSVENAMAQVGGVYVPSLHSPFIGRGAGAPAPQRRHVEDLSRLFCTSVILSTRSHLGGMFLAEVARGCTKRCRFCAVSSAYSPLRFVPASSLLERLDAAGSAARTVGLLGACVADHPGLTGLARTIAARKQRVSVSSVRADAGRAELIPIVAGSGTRTLTIAPEAGTARLRNLIGKELAEERLFETARCASESGFTTLKLYFMLGLPGERAEDVDAVASLTHAVSKRFEMRGKFRSVTLSVSPFVPKASTPFQWFGAEREEAMRLKLRRLSTEVRKLKAVRYTPPGVRSWMLEAALSRGSWKTGRALHSLVFEETGLRKAWQEAGLSFEQEVSAPAAPTAPLPWDHVYAEAARARVRSLYEKARGKV
ncbi:MAG: radical SAM protein [Candidatus Eisenbacteria bacterium]|nr:radical SAM protein [Candidatus Eisenbacteria bacterium]